jgi:hypothetical protein
MALSYTTTIRNARLDAITTAVSTSGLIRIYSGTPPANVGTALSGNTQLAELACSATFAAAASGGVLTLNTVTADSSADATGTATFFRILTSGGTAQVQGTVTATGGGGDMTLATVSIVASATVSLTSNTITAGNA